MAMEVEEMEKARIRKRPRLGWDVAPSRPEAQRALVTSRRSSPPKRDDDHEGHYVFNLGENLTPRYKILSKMGEGTFGRVLECWDRQNREYVAIKVVRSIRKYRDAAMIEVDVLEHLAKNDKGTSHFVQIRNWFDYRNHICIIWGTNSGMTMKMLGMVQRGSSDETHFRCLPKSSAIKLIDFGSTAFDNQNHSSIVSTRHYRAPEIILGLGWSYPCDLWSVGCILIELCTGEALFQTHENLEHLAMMERVLGPLPEHMIRRANRGAEKYFRRGSRLNWPEGAVSRESIRAVRKLDRLKNIVSRYVESSRYSLADMLEGLLKYDPSERLTARQALNHPFFRYPN
ncbi:serine/threonine-protein kinase AFC3-like isoform X2 [Gossypium arboreum]|uniref:serine/threonine-protein kinase AFC3-like isoform X2 n=1 Tax=Gossypium arboreum TaxID=29729 RepID=UPI0022F14622|nr:serine/threonine-protein kinase AFC3-like isoform X2 [Gossypium arboreum]